MIRATGRSRMTVTIRSPSGENATSPNALPVSCEGKSGSRRPSLRLHRRTVPSPAPVRNVSPIGAGNCEVGRRARVRQRCEFRTRRDVPSWTGPGLVVINRVPSALKAADLKGPAWRRVAMTLPASVFQMRDVPSSSVARKCLPSGLNHPGRRRRSGTQFGTQAAGFCIPEPDHSVRRRRRSPPSLRFEGHILDVNSAFVE